MVVRYAALRMPLLRREDAVDRSAGSLGVDDLRVTLAQRLLNLVGAYRHVTSIHHTLEQSERRRQLRASVIGECRLVAMHARTAPAREHETAELGLAHALRPKSRLPPRLASRRTRSMTMSWDSALHMS